MGGGLSRHRSVLVLALTALLCLLLPSTASAGPPGREVHPLPGPAPVEVSIWLNVVEVSDVRDKDQEFDVELYIYQSWHARALAGGEEKQSLPISGNWTPNEEFIGARAIKRESDNTLEVFPDGTVRHTQHVWATLAVDFDLHKFPFDRHPLPLRVESYSYPANEVVFVHAQDEATGDRPKVTQGWKLQAVESRVELEDYPEEDTQYSSYVHELVAARASSFYLWKIILPLCLILSMSWSVFWIEPKNFGPRMSVAVTTMLSVVAFNFAIANTLPKISYVTRMDLFIVTGYVFVFGAFLENLAVHVLGRNDKNTTAARLDRRCRMAFPAVFALVLLAFLTWP